MAAFLEDITPFIGTGENNEQGLSLKAFLDDYDPKKYECPCVTTDIIVIRYQKGLTTVKKGLKLLMIKRRNHPGIGMWALPGGFAEMREDLIHSAKRELKEETNLDNIPLEQLYTWGKYDRDPRCRIITTSFLALVEDGTEGMKAGDDAADADWMDIELRSRPHTWEQGLKKDRIYTQYDLRLQNLQRGINVTATVLFSENAEKGLREPDYKVLQQDGIAFDHPNMIIQALRYIETNYLN